VRNLAFIFYHPVAFEELEEATLELMIHTAVFVWKKNGTIVHNRGIF